MAEHKVSRSSPFVGKAAELLLWSGSLFSLSAARRLGWVIGSLMAAVPNTLRSASRINLDFCLPQLSPKERRRLTRVSLIETARTYTELGVLWYRDTGELATHETEVVGEELLDQAMAAGRGVVLLVPHLGNWEFLNHFLASRHPFVGFYRPPRVAELERLLCRVRERTGCEMVRADRAGLRKLYRSLNEGRLVLILPDQEPTKTGGLYSPFFGIPALTMTLASRLLRKTGARALCAFALRRPRGGFRITFREPRDDLAAGNPRTSVDRLNQAIEMCVRETPEQYQWSYKRFKTRPEGQLTPYRLRGRPFRITRQAQIQIEATRVRPEG